MKNYSKEVIKKVSLNSSHKDDKTLKVEVSIEFESGKWFKKFIYHSIGGSCFYENLSPGDIVTVVIREDKIRGIAKSA